MGPGEYATWYLGDFERELRGGYLVEHETNEGQATALAHAQIVFGDYRLAANELQRYRGVDLGDVIHAVRRYMHDMQFAYVGDTSHFRPDWIRR
jgi:predicted Zn-dependent peptidase